jgi:hypothetical protein
MEANKLQIYQIAYDEASLESVKKSGFLLLDNLSNKRPDWYEYWPIRGYLSTHVMDEDVWYGFFSPKFSEKTGLGMTEVRAFVEKVTAAKDVDVVLFSPQPDMGAHFLNVFEQAEMFDTGFIQTAKNFLGTVGMQLPLEGIVMDSRQIVFSNYFIAKPAFWREWFQLTEVLFGVAENPAHPLHAELTTNTSYSENSHRKVFLMERIASLLLFLRPEYKVAAANTFQFSWSMSKLRQSPEKAYISDALKIAFKELGFPQYMDAFRKIRQSL